MCFQVISCFRPGRKDAQTLLSPAEPSSSMSFFFKDLFMDPLTLLSAAEPSASSSMSSNPLTHLHIAQIECVLM